MTESLILMFLLFAAYLYRPQWIPIRLGSRSAQTGACQQRGLIPQDAILRRHFVSHLRAEIENTLQPRPSDSIQRRHYESLVSLKLQQRMAELDPLATD